MRPASSRHRTARPSLQAVSTVGGTESIIDLKVARPGLCSRLVCRRGQIVGYERQDPPRSGRILGGHAGHSKPRLVEVVRSARRTPDVQTICGIASASGGTRSLGGPSRDELRSLQKVGCSRSWRGLPELGETPKTWSGGCSDRRLKLRCSRTRTQSIRGGVAMRPRERGSRKMIGIVL